MNTKIEIKTSEDIRYGLDDEIDDLINECKDNSDYFTPNDERMIKDELNNKRWITVNDVNRIKRNIIQIIRNCPRLFKDGSGNLDTTENYLENKINNEFKELK